MKLPAVLFLIAVLFLPCAAQSPIPVSEQKGRHLDPAQAVQIAKLTAKKRGIDLAAFHEPKVSLKRILDRWVWLVSFAAKPVSLGGLVADGDHFTYIIDDVNRTVEVLGGM